jgi:hypothetical protein
MIGSPRHLRSSHPDSVSSVQSRLLITLNGDSSVPLPRISSLPLRKDIVYDAAQSPGLIRSPLHPSRVFQKRDVIVNLTKDMVDQGL